MTPRATILCGLRLLSGATDVLARQNAGWSIRLADKASLSKNAEAPSERPKLVGLTRLISTQQLRRNSPANTVVALTAPAGGRSARPQFCNRSAATAAAPWLTSESGGSTPTGLNSGDRLTYSHGEKAVRRITFKRTTLHSSRTFIVPLIFLFVGCGTARLPPTTWVQPTTMSDILKSVEERQRNKPAPSEITLLPGDVLYLRRWSTGTTRAVNVTTPLRVVDRIPIRKVASTGGLLRDYEMELLVNFVVTNRNSITQPPATDIVPKLKEHAVAMFNALIDKLRLVRVSNEVLQVKVAYVDVLRAGTFLQNGTLNAYFRRPEINPDGTFNNDTSYDLFGFNTAYRESPLEIMLGSPVGNSRYYEPSVDGQGHLFTFVTAALNDIDFRRPGPEESHWTLKDIEQSGICTEGVSPTAEALEIAALRLRGSSKTFWVDGRSPRTHEIKYENGRLRSIAKVKETSVLATFALVNTELTRLTINDVTRIRWRRVSDKKLTDGPARCQPL